MQFREMNSFMKNSYYIRDMREWENLNAKLIIADVPFGICFDGKNKNTYNRKSENIVGGYLEWNEDEYEKNISELLDVIYINLDVNSQALIFSGWNKSYVIHKKIRENDSLYLKGKLYWRYNFSPYCDRRPNHNVYEIFWLVNGENYYYNNECSFDHCQSGEGNLSVIDINKEYRKGISKYTTMFPLELVLVLLEHFSDRDYLVFDPLAGSGIVGIGCEIMGRKYILGDLNRKGKFVFKELKKFYKKKKEKIKNRLEIKNKKTKIKQKSVLG